MLYSHFFYGILGLEFECKYQFGGRGRNCICLDSQWFPDKCFIHGTCNLCLHVARCQVHTQLHSLLPAHFSGLPAHLRALEPACVGTGFWTPQACICAQTVGCTAVLPKVGCAGLVRCTKLFTCAFSPCHHIPCHQVQTQLPPLFSPCSSRHHVWLHPRDDEVHICVEYHQGLAA